MPLYQEALDEVFSSDADQLNFLLYSIYAHKLRRRV